MYTVGFPTSFEIIISILEGLLFTTIIFALLQLPRVLGRSLVTLFVICVLGLAVLAHFGGEAPDFASFEEAQKSLVNTNPVIAHVPTSTPAEDFQKYATYESVDHVLRFDHPAHISIGSIASSTWQTLLGPVDMVFPAGSIEIPGLFVVSRIPYADISYQKPIIDWHSCCSGIKYWYDSGKNIWQAEKFQNSDYDDDGKASREVKNSFSLIQDNTCSLNETFDKKSFYKISTTEEGVPIETSYFLLTNKGYAIRFMSQYDARGDYAGMTGASVPDVRTLEAMKNVLSSVNVGGNVTEIRAECR